MQRAYEKSYHDLESTHWWFVSRRNAILTILSELPKTTKILEIGCSGGILLQQLADYGFASAEGIDISPHAIETCRKRGIENVRQAAGEKTGLPNSSIDLIIASDVLEHIDNAHDALVEWQRILRPAGKIILFVPAFMALWSEHDEANEHKKRYTKTEIKQLLKKNDFHIQKLSYWNFFLFFPTLILRQILKFKKKTTHPQSQLFPLPSFINTALMLLLSLENFLLLRAGIPFPFGISVFCLAHKNQVVREIS